MLAHIGLLAIVDDLHRALTSYRDGLGLETRGVVGTELEYGAVAFFDLRGGLKLALWPRDSTAHYAAIVGTPPNPTDFTLRNVRTRRDVKRVATRFGVAMHPTSARALNPRILGGRPGTRTGCCSNGYSMAAN